ncbi:MAG: serine/threonine protein kinase [Acidobacteriota bacterium]
MLQSSGSLAGKRFGNYVAFEMIGQGGMGSVYLAEHPEIGRKVAIKVLGRQHNEEMVQRFTDEARAVSRIGHPNIIDIYDFGRTEAGRLYYVMEWLDGRELRAVMNERAPMAAIEVRPYVEQICAAIHAAHERGVVHRDLKPANIFVLNREPLTIKVLDFGVAKLLDTGEVSGRTSPGIVIGTPMFTAPEQAAAEASKICAQTDLYAFGVILYWMLSGQPPFMADNNSVLLAMHVCDKPRPLRQLVPSLPEGIASLVEQCLEKNPKDRPRSARMLASAYLAALDEVGPAPDPGYDDGPSGVMVFVPPTPVVEVATAATAAARPAARPSGPATAAKVSFSPLAAVSPVTTAELGAEEETEVEPTSTPRPSAPKPVVTVAPLERPEPAQVRTVPDWNDQDEIPTLPPPGANDAARPGPLEPELSIGGQQPEVVVHVPTTPTPRSGAPRAHPALAHGSARVDPPPARSTNWLPWVLVAISLAVAVAIAVLK